jgi:hypothetical protein
MDETLLTNGRDALFDSKAFFPVGFQDSEALMAAFGDRSPSAGALRGGK